MLYYYVAAAANDNNWLHLWFVAAFTAAMNAIDAGEAPPAWNEVTAPYAAALQNRYALKADFEALVFAFKAASQQERLLTRKALQSQNDVQQACASGVSTRADSLAQPIAIAAIRLGERLFDLLGELKIRKAHFHQIWTALDAQVCPFCGQNDLDPPDLPAEDLDHYLSRKIYPFAAANLTNLAPMCSRCNMDYKGTKDVLSGTGQIQRHYPYDQGDAGAVELSGSHFFANGDEAPPEWCVTLLPQAKADEWDRIFDLRRRFRRSILDNRWLNWLEEWVAVLPEAIEQTVDSLSRNLEIWSMHWAALGLREKAFLKAAYLALIREALSRGDLESEQLFAVILDMLAMRKDPMAA